LKYYGIVNSVTKLPYGLLGNDLVLYSETIKPLVYPTEQLAIDLYDSLQDHKKNDKEVGEINLYFMIENLFERETQESIKDKLCLLRNHKNKIRTFLKSTENLCMDFEFDTDDYLYDCLSNRLEDIDRRIKMYKQLRKEI
jgi:hypothetical protein